MRTTCVAGGDGSAHTPTEARTASASNAHVSRRRSRRAPVSEAARAPRPSSSSTAGSAYASAAGSRPTRPSRTPYGPAPATGPSTSRAADSRDRRPGRRDAGWRCGPHRFRRLRLRSCCPRCSGPAASGPWNLRPHPGGLRRFRFRCRKTRSRCRFSSRPGSRASTRCLSARGDSRPRTTRAACGCHRPRSPTTRRCPSRARRCHRRPSRTPSAPPS